VKVPFADLRASVALHRRIAGSKSGDTPRQRRAGEYRLTGGRCSIRLTIIGAVMPDAVEESADLLRERMKDAGVRVTPQRLEIFRAVWGSQNHPAAEDVWKDVRTRAPGVSLDTVYRALRLFEDMNLVYRVNMDSRHARFDANMAEHHHFVCASCGIVSDIFPVTAVAVPPEASLLGAVHRVRLEAKGVCHACAGVAPQPSAVS